MKPAHARSRDKNRGRPAAPRPPVEKAEVSISRLGAQGEGIAELNGQPIYVRGGLPGETVRVTLLARRGDGWLARTDSVIASPSPDRVSPVCRHADRCGGCSLQHLSAEGQAALKTERVRRAMARAGLEAAPLRPILTSPPGSRRRASFAVRHTAHGIVIGFNEAAGSTVIDLAECPVSHPSLLALLPLLRQGLAPVLPPAGRCDAVATVTQNGIDLLLTDGPPLTLAAREALAELAETANLARLTWRSAGERFEEPLARRRPATVDLGGLEVEPPPGAFLQATPEGQAALIAAVLDSIPATATRVADLYAGCGTFTGPLARRGAAVHAVEALTAPLAALDRAARRGQVRVTTEERDLDSEPLPAALLKTFDAVVIDPPRAGARRQSEELAMSGVPLVVSISCDPETFARDARLLTEAGYRLDWVQPVDQFTFSGHVEVVARLTRPPLA
jgi:23S rRNA (uracil1939-C5)-methyltransferase